MIRNLILASALAGSLLASTTASSQATTALPTMQHHGVDLVRWHGGGWHGGWHGGGFHHHRGFGGLWLVPPLAVGAYYAGSYYGGCGWLYRRAITTDSPYWWHRYHECVYW